MPGVLLDVLQPECLQKIEGGPAVLMASKTIHFRCTPLVRMSAQPGATITQAEDKIWKCVKDSGIKFTNYQFLEAYYFMLTLRGTEHIFIKTQEK